MLTVVVVVFQGDAGQKGAGQTGPEGSGGDSGEFKSTLSRFFVISDTDDCK